jgi:hypothetical protein
MNRLLFLGLFLASTTPLYAQGAQPDAAKLKADAQKVVSIVKSDKAKTQTYWQINGLGGEIDLAAQARDEQKADVLTKKINELEKQLGPEYLALFDALNNACIVLQLGRIRFSLRKQRRCRNKQTCNDQQPVQMARSHKQALLRRVSFSERW